MDLGMSLASVLWQADERPSGRLGTCCVINRDTESPSKAMEREARCLLIA